MNIGNDLFVFRVYTHTKVNLNNVKYCLVDFVHCSNKIFSGLVSKHPSSSILICVYWHVFTNTWIN